MNYNRNDKFDFYNRNDKFDFYKHIGNTKKNDFKVVSSNFLHSITYGNQNLGFSFYRKPLLKELILIHIFKKEINLFCEYKLNFKNKAWLKSKTTNHSEKLFQKALDEALNNHQFAEIYYKVIK